MVMSINPDLSDVTNIRKTTLKNQPPTEIEYNGKHYTQITSICHEGEHTSCGHYYTHTSRENKIYNDNIIKTVNTQQYTSHQYLTMYTQHENIHAIQTNYDEIINENAQQTIYETKENQRNAHNQIQDQNDRKTQNSDTQTKTTQENQHTTYNDNNNEQNEKEIPETDDTNRQKTNDKNKQNNQNTPLNEKDIIIHSEENAQFLGRQIQARNKTNIAVNYRINKAKNAWETYGRHFFTKQLGNTTPQLVIVWNSVVRSVITYSMECVPLTQYRNQKIDSFTTKCLRKIKNKHRPWNHIVNIIDTTCKIYMKLNQPTTSSYITRMRTHRFLETAMHDRKNIEQTNEIITKIRQQLCTQWERIKASYNKIRTREWGNDENKKIRYWLLTNQNIEQYPQVEKMIKMDYEIPTIENIGTKHDAQLLKDITVIMLEYPKTTQNTSTHEQKHWKCPTCGKAMINEESLNKHRAMSVKCIDRWEWEKYAWQQCPAQNCTATLQGSKELKLHAKYQCKFRKNQWSKRENNQQTETDRRKQKTKVQDEDEQTQYNKQLHYNSQTKTWTCQICGQCATINGRTSIHNHMLTHYKEKYRKYIKQQQELNDWTNENWELIIQKSIQKEDAARAILLNVNINERLQYRMERQQKIDKTQQEFRRKQTTMNNNQRIKHDATQTNGEIHKQMDSDNLDQNEQSQTVVRIGHATKTKNGIWMCNFPQCEWKSKNTNKIHTVICHHKANHDQLSTNRIKWCACPYCETEFRRKQNLYIHMNLRMTIQTRSKHEMREQKTDAKETTNDKQIENSQKTMHIAICDNIMNMPAYPVRWYETIAYNHELAQQSPQHYIQMQEGGTTD